MSTGEFVKQDPDAARAWYEKAAAEGFMPARTNLGIMLLAQGGDTARAVALLEQASGAGETLAMAILAGHLFRTDPTPERLARARSLLEVAVRAGWAEARRGLGYLMASGLGGPQDLDAGLQLMNQAAAQGDARAAIVLGFLRAACESWPVPEAIRDQLSTLGWTGFEVDTLVQIATTYRERELRKADEPVDRSNRQALFERDVYLSQKAKPPDIISAYECYARAANMGHSAAAYNLGYLYLNGQGVKRNVQTGLDWMRRAAESGAPRMQYELAVLLSQGIITAPDCEQAVHWYRRAAEQGFAPGVPQSCVVLPSWRHRREARSRRGPYHVQKGGGGTA